MKIDEAISKLRSEMCSNTISSEQAGMYKQNESTILFWLLFDSRSRLDGEKFAVRTLKKIIAVDDWKVDGETE